MTITIGLTGSIATGKSTVAEMFRKYKIPVIDADIISRQVVEPGHSAYKRIVVTFGKEILLEDKTINRKKLGKIIFNDEEKREQLNNIVHPAVREEMLRQKDQLVSKQVRAIVMDIPLLFESKLTHIVDKILVVSVDKETQLTRLMERDKFTVSEARSRIDAQLPVREKAVLADVVIDNSKTISDTESQLVQILQKWKIL